MVKLRASKPEELPDFHAMEQDANTRDNILAYSLQKHRDEFESPHIVYLSIYTLDELAGFFILKLESDRSSIEFRRLVIKRKGQGIGQAAILAMEDYCRDQLMCKRIWLDVFDFNHRGRHVYEKLGYRYFESGELNGKTLLFYQKSLTAPPTADPQA